MPEVYAPRLRILIDPVYVQSGYLSSSSTYHKYVSLVRELVGRGHYCYWMIPDNEYIPNEIESHPHVGIIRTSYISDQFVVDGLVTDAFYNLFNRIAGKYHIDAVVTSRNSLALTYKRVLDPPRFHDTDRTFTDKGYGVPLVLLEEFPQTRERQHTGRSYWLSQVMGYISSDRSVFLSEHNRNEVVAGMREHLATSEIRRWLDRSRIIPAGVEVAELDRILNDKRWRLDPTFNVISIGRLFGVSHIEFVPWFDYLYKAGLSDVSLTISLSGTLSGPMRHKLKNVGFDFNSVGEGKQFRVIENNPRPNFLRMLRRFKCFIAPVAHLDHPTGIFEALYLGLPGILPVSDYQQTFFKDYPFVIEPKDKSQLIGRLMWIRENQAEAREMVAPWRDEIRKNYDAHALIKTLADEIELVGRDYINRFKTSAGVLDILRKLKGDRYSWADVVEYLRKAPKIADTKIAISVGNMKMRTTFTYARGAIHHSMRMIGFVDPCDHPDDRFLRRAIFDKETQGDLRISAKPKPKRRSRKKNGN